MSATFDPALPTLKDHARLLVGDFLTAGGTVGAVSNPLLQDETYVTLLTNFTFAQAVVSLCDALLTLAGQQPSKYQEYGGVTIDWEDRSKNWTGLREQARTGKLFSPVTKPRSPIALGHMRLDRGNMRTD